MNTAPLNRLKEKHYFAIVYRKQAKHSSNIQQQQSVAKLHERTISLMLLIIKSQSLDTR
uniref:Uncharacterized protein n=1 Tax=Cucumis melo TaxID=3656 RepID=A0A9I9D9M7_CUCME